MSCDHGVWHTPARLTAEEAGELYQRLCEEDTSEVAPHPGIQAFYDEFTRLHPELDDVADPALDDHERCPWSGPLERSGGHVILSCVWSGADAVNKLVASLAAKHGLTFYDPQSERVVQPGGMPPKKPRWKFW